jgi:hypothetical protein
MIPLMGIIVIRIISWNIQCIYNHIYIFNGIQLYIYRVGLQLEHEFGNGGFTPRMEVGKPHFGWCILDDFGLDRLVAIKHGGLNRNLFETPELLG